MNSQPSIQLLNLTKALNKLIVLSIIFSALSFTSVKTFAQAIDPAMLAQLQSMPKAQQQALAKQYGIDLNSINRSGTVTKTSLAQEGEPLQQRTQQDFNQWLEQQQAKQRQTTYMGSGRTPNRWGS